MFLFLISLGHPILDHGLRATSHYQLQIKVLQDDPGGVLIIKWSWRREAKTFEPRQLINHKLLELETTKQILEEVFHARPSDVEDMIQRRLDEKSSNEDSWTKEEEPWPREFCLGE